jgi:hypothetical protein
MQAPKHIAAGLTTLTNKAGNDKADEIADIGTNLHGKHLIKIAAEIMTDIKHIVTSSLMWPPIS